MWVNLIHFSNCSSVFPFSLSRRFILQFFFFKQFLQFHSIFLSHSGHCGLQNIKILFWSLLKTIKENLKVTWDFGWVQLMHWIFPTILPIFLTWTFYALHLLCEHSPQFEITTLGTLYTGEGSEFCIAKTDYVRCATSVS